MDPNFVCSQQNNARLPSTAATVVHVNVEDVSACQAECIDAGKTQCNAYSFEPSDIAPNCTIGYVSRYTQPLSHTTDASAIAGYCVSKFEAVGVVAPPPSVGECTF
jgi:hypothetical protein